MEVESRRDAKYPAEAAQKNPWPRLDYRLPFGALALYLCEHMLRKRSHEVMSARSAELFIAT